MLHLNRKAEIQILCGAIVGGSTGTQQSSDIFFAGQPDGGGMAGGGSGGGGMGLVEYIVEKIKVDAT